MWVNLVIYVLINKNVFFLFLLFFFLIFISVISKRLYVCVVCGIFSLMFIHFYWLIHPPNTLKGKHLSCCCTSRFFRAFSSTFIFSSLENNAEKTYRCCSSKKRDKCHFSNTASDHMFVMDSMRLKMCVCVYQKTKQKRKKKILKRSSRLVFVVDLWKTKTSREFLFLGTQVRG